jgi:tetratricopeptide (TPR) repeat protein
VGASGREERHIHYAKRRLPEPKMKGSALLAEAEELLRIGRADEALLIGVKALKALQSDSTTTKTRPLPALNLIAEIHLELGDGDSARKYFQSAINLDPEGTVGGAEPFLWLAQLSEEGGQDSVTWFERGATVLRNEIARMGDGDEGEGMEKRKKLASALCGIIEVYMTDLSWEEYAEEKCESLIAESLLVAPHSPEPLQTLASIRISQARVEEAKRALSDSMELWGDLEPEDVAVPDFPTRISLARLLMEVEMEEEALEVVERLVGEDDQSVEAWYLGGWCLNLLGEKRRKNDARMDRGAENGDDEEDLYTTSMVSSREWLRQSLKLYELLEYADERLRDHAMELVEVLDRELEEHDANDGVDRDGAEEEWNGIAEEEDDDEDENEDHDMDGT